MIQSHELPAELLVVGNKVRVRYNIQTKTRLDNEVESTYYEYEEEVFDSSVDKSIRDARVAKLEAEAVKAETQTAKELALDSITVEVSGKVFEGRAKDQVNIMAAIQAAELLGQTSTEWKLADNTLYTVTVDELKQVLALSIQKVGQIVKGEV